MYRIIRALNNNALLVTEKQSGQEKIILGKGIGFGKKADMLIEPIPDTREYLLTTSEAQKDFLNQNLDSRYLEAAAHIIDEAERVFGRLNRDIILPLAEHIAFSVKRIQEGIYIPNPFVPDIKALFAREYTVAIKSADAVEQLAGYVINEEEAGFIAMHIHSGLAGEAVSETLRKTQIVDTALQMAATGLQQMVSLESLTCSRLISHLYYMLERVRSGEAVNLELNDVISLRYPKAWRIAVEICSYISEQMQKELDVQERGYLAIHIERMRAENLEHEKGYE